MILERLNQGIVIGDGGMIFELERRGYVAAGPFTPEATLEHPEAVKQVQIDFARAGAEVLQAATYYAHEEKLRDVGLEGKLPEINRNAVAIAKGVAADYGCLVAGNLANTWVYQPGDEASARETRRQLDAQVEHQMDDAVDFFIAETIEYLGEAKLAVDAIKAAGRPAMITLGYKYSDRTYDGYALEDAFKALEDHGADIVGINCFRDPARMLPLAERVIKAVSIPVATQPVAYRCSPERPYFTVQEWGGRVAFPLELDPFTLTRIEMASYAVEARDLGVRYIGACCGTGPHHIRAMAMALGRRPPAAEYAPRLELHTIIGDDSHQRHYDERSLCEGRKGVEACREEE